MLTLIARRALISLATLLIATLLVFTLFDALPGDIGSTRLSRFSDPIAAVYIREERGLYRGFFVRYLEWVSYVVNGELGRSWGNGREISELLKSRFFNTGMLALAATVLGVPIAVSLGILSAIRRDTWLDRIVQAGTLGLFSIPEFALGYCIVFLLAIYFPLFPSISIVADCPSHPGRGAQYPHTAVYRDGHSERSEDLAYLSSTRVASRPRSDL